jgi:hypothetical protein
LAVSSVGASGHDLEAVQRRLDENPRGMQQRRETVEHPFGTLKMRSEMADAKKLAREADRRLRPPTSPFRV